MHGAPQKEHEWLMRLVGDWTFEGEGISDPGQPPHKIGGSETARSIGGMWLQIEGHVPGGSEGPDMTSQITLGYDPAKGRFVGSFIASVMNMMWLYEGQLDADGKVLTLDARGPTMTGGWTDYQDIFTQVDADHWRLTSRIKGEDGSWTQFMSSDHRRVKA